jgi:phosphoribosylglycinamide formyltransferase-1
VAILKALQDAQFDLILLLGYMKKVGSRLVHAFGWRSEYSSPYQAIMLNSHAGLFPDTKGYYGIHKEERVLAGHFPFSGYTLHVVAEDYDDGPTIAEHKQPVEPSDTIESLLVKDQALEKQYLPSDVETFLKARGKYLKEKR